MGSLFFFLHFSAFFPPLLAEAACILGAFSTIIPITVKFFVLYDWKYTLLFVIL